MSIESGVLFNFIKERYFVLIIRRFGYNSYAAVSFFYQNFWLNISLFSFVSFILKKSSIHGQMSFLWETFMSTTNKILKFEQNDSFGKFFKNSLVYCNSFHKIITVYKMLKTLKKSSKTKFFLSVWQLD